MFTLIPTVATISYLLAAILLMLTLFTSFPLGVKKVIPFRVHGAVELTAAILLMVLPAFMGDDVTFYDSLFFILTGTAILLIWLVTRYKKAPSPPSPQPESQNQES